MAKSALAKVMTIRMTLEQHDAIVRMAQSRQVSVNTLVLSACGLASVYDQHGKPRGRKPKTSVTAYRSTTEASNADV